MTIAYGVMSTPKPERIKMRRDLQKELNRPLMESEDATGKGPAWNMVQCLRMMQNFTPASYYVVFQDDIQLARKLAPALEQSVPTFFAEHPGAILGLFNNTSRAKLARDRDQVYFRLPLTGRNWLWTYGVVFTAATADSFCYYYEQCERLNDWPPRSICKHTDPPYRGQTYIVDDSFLAEFIERFGYEAWCVTGSLVQHVGGLQSQLGHKFKPESGKNYSPNFVGRDRDASEHLKKRAKA